MVRIWLKVIKDNKIVEQTIYERDEKFTYSHFIEYVSEGCYNLDISTPVIIKTHLFNFAKYNGVKFVPSDFLEKVDFDSLFIENLNIE